VSLSNLRSVLVHFSFPSSLGIISSYLLGDIDADTCRAEWNKLSQSEKDHYGYEAKLLHCLDNIVKQCDRKIEKQKLRAEQDMDLTDEDLQRIAVMYKQVADLVEQVEYYSDRGDIDRAMEIMKQVDVIKESSRKITNPPEEKKITVCEISGNFMSSRDNDDRMRAHFEVSLSPPLLSSSFMSLPSSCSYPRSLFRENNLLAGNWFETNMLSF
jgi:hypothetical protein